MKLRCPPMREIVGQGSRAPLVDGLGPTRAIGERRGACAWCNSSPGSMHSKSLIERREHCAPPAHRRHAVRLPILRITWAGFLFLSVMLKVR